MYRRFPKKKGALRALNSWEEGGYFLLGKARARSAVGSAYRPNRRCN